MVPACLCALSTTTASQSSCSRAAQACCSGRQRSLRSSYWTCCGAFLAMLMMRMAGSWRACGRVLPRSSLRGAGRTTGRRWRRPCLPTTLQLHVVLLVAAAAGSRVLLDRRPPHARPRRLFDWVVGVCNWCSGTCCCVTLSHTPTVSAAPCATSVLCMLNVMCL